MSRVSLKKLIKLDAFSFGRDLIMGVAFLVRPVQVYLFIENYGLGVKDITFHNKLSTFHQIGPGGFLKMTLALGQNSFIVFILNGQKLPSYWKP